MYYSDEKYALNRKWFETCALLLGVSLNVTSAVCCSLMQTWVRQTAAFFSGDWREWRWHTHFCCATLLRDCRQMGQMDWCCPSLWASVCVYTHPCMFTCLSPLWSLAHTLQELDFDFDLSGRLCLVSTSRRELHASLSSVRSVNIDCIGWSKCWRGVWAMFMMMGDVNKHGGAGTRKLCEMRWCVQSMRH